MVAAGPGPRLAAARTAPLVTNMIVAVRLAAIALRAVMDIAMGTVIAVLPVGSTMMTAPVTGPRRVMVVVLPWMTILRLPRVAGTIMTRTAATIPLLIRMPTAGPTIDLLPAISLPGTLAMPVRAAIRESTIAQDATGKSTPKKNLCRAFEPSLTLILRCPQNKDGAVPQPQPCRQKADNFRLSRRGYV